MLLIKCDTCFLLGVSEGAGKFPSSTPCLGRGKVVGIFSGMKKIGIPLISGPGALSDHQRLHGFCVLRGHRRELSHRHRGPRPVPEATLTGLNQTQLGVFVSPTARQLSQCLPCPGSKGKTERDMRWEFQVRLGSGSSLNVKPRVTI